MVLGIFLLGAIVTFSATLVAAQGDVEIGGNMHQVKQQAQVQVTYRFRQRTRLRVNSSAPVQLKMDCDAMNIGDRIFDLAILNATEDIALNMTCRQNEEELGVQNGSLVRNRVRAQVRTGFCIQIECNLTVRARIGMEMTQGEATRASWAYFDDETDEWVAVESTYEDGMLVATTDHFSVWTVVDGSVIGAGLWAVIGASLVAVAALTAILIRKKKVQVVQ